MSASGTLWPPPCPACGSREATSQDFTVDDMFTEAFNARPGPMILCAGCGGERKDLYGDPLDLYDDGGFHDCNS